jgi:hypothetical protein
MASISKLLVLSGLPGSGKSELLRSGKFPRVTGLRVHDFHHKAINNSPLPKDSRHFRAVVEALKAGHDCIIADVEFCREVRRNAVVEAIRDEVPEVLVEFHCFRNQPDRCKANVRRRGRAGVEEELRKVDEISSVYEIPANAVEYDVFEPRDTAQYSKADLERPMDQILREEEGRE